MSSSISNENPEQRKKARRTLLTILAICIAPFVAATIAFNFFPTSGRVNYGDLLPPTPLPDDVLGELKGKWVLLHFDSGACGAACETKLFNMRQSRTAQGREMDRIERAWVVLDDKTPATRQQPLYEGVYLLRNTPERFIEAFPASANARAAHIYLIDPLGNVMLRFPADADPKRMIKDLQRLLKVSRTG